MSPINHFQCQRCGNCCRHAGEVRLTDVDIEAIAGFLGMNIHDFTGRYTRMRPDRRGLSLLERTDGACIFLHDDPTACEIHGAKPEQCGSFPAAWRYADLAAVCPAASSA